MITVKVSSTGLKESLTTIDRFLDPDEIKKRAEKLCERLAYIGVKEASVRFTQAFSTSASGVSCYAEPMENGWRIVAEGEDVCFIEFGAGVYYNGPEPYPLPRPAGIAGIGEYGQGKGKQDGWWYYDSSGKPAYTHGTPAAMPMYHASKEMLESVAQVANEVFND